MNVTAGQPVNYLPNAIRSGYTFLGWYTATTGGQQFTQGSLAPNQNTTYYARWQQGTGNPTVYSDSFSRLSGTLNSWGGSPSALAPATAPSILNTAWVTSVSVRLVVSSGSSPVYLWVISPEGSYDCKGTYGVGTHTVTFNYFNGEDPRGTWYTAIETTGLVSTATTTITVNYQHT